MPVHRGSQRRSLEGGTPKAAPKTKKRAAPKKKNGAAPKRAPSPSIFRRTRAGGAGLLGAAGSLDAAPIHPADRVYRPMARGQAPVNGEIFGAANGVSPGAGPRARRIAEHQRQAHLDRLARLRGLGGGRTRYTL